MVAGIEIWLISVLFMNFSLCTTTKTSSLQLLVNNENSGESSCKQGTVNLTHCNGAVAGDDFTSYICPDLDSSLEYISNATQYGNISVAHVCLPSGYFTLTTPRYLNVSVTLTGLINQSIIQCDYDSKKNIATSEDELQFTLSFSGVSFVRFDFVQFDSCPQPFRITLVEDVVISNSRFERFSEGVFDIFNSNNITIVSSSFIDNYSTGTVLLPFRGNTGAVAVGYNNDKLSSVINLTILVEYCLFINNSATASTKTLLTSTEILSNGVFPSRGGGFGLFMREPIQNISAHIVHCHFTNNYAFSFGGGIYVVFNGGTNQHKVTIDNCHFVNNTARLGAGGTLLIYLSNGDINFPMTTIIRNCYYIRNNGETGGAMYIFPEYTLGGDGNVAIITNCTFLDNEASSYGGAIATAIYSLFRYRSLLPLYHISNCTFKRNRCLDGVVNIGYIPFALKGKNTFASNIGPALRIIGSIVQIHDEVLFTDNETPDGGALYINSFGQIMMFSNSSMTFERNRGQIGASIVVSTRTVSSVFNMLVNNPQCFLLYYTRGTPFSEIHDVSIKFSDNSAIEASAISLPSTQHCLWAGNTYPYFDTTITHWPFLNISDRDLTTTGINSSYIETSAASIHFINDTVSGWPGKLLSLSIELFDEAGQTCSEFLQVQIKHNNKPTTAYRIQPTLLYQRNSKLNISYAIEDTGQNQPGYFNTNINTSITVTGFLSEDVRNSVTLTATHCLAGSRLAYHSELGGLTCQCNTDLEHIRNCEDDQRTILLTDGVWGIEQAHNTDENLVVYPCPPGYCNCILQHNNLGEDVCSFAYFNSNPDKQCVCERKGYLCGDCRDGKGVSALLNHCVDCSNAYGILIGVLVIIDGALIFILLFKNVKFTVLLFPTIFFINMVSYVGENFPTSYDKVGRYMYYLNSFLSLYFPYDFCLYSGTTALASFTFRHIPFSLTIIVCSIVVTWFRYSAKNTRKIPWDSLWLLLTLQYSHVIYTSMTVLNCPRVVNENGEFEFRWFINGTRNCFARNHLPLGLWAIIILLVCSLLIPFLALVTVGIIKKPHWLSHLSKCLRQPFKEDVPWWCAVELGRKLFMLLLLVPFPQNTCPPLLTLMMMLTLYAYVMPYKDLLVNIIELLFQLSLTLLLLLKSTRDIVDTYLVFPHNKDSSDTCSDKNNAATLTWMLFPFAYFPLAVITIIIIMNMTHKVWQCCKDKHIMIPHLLQEAAAPTNPTCAAAAATITAGHHFSMHFVDGVLQIRQSGRSATDATKTTDDSLSTNTSNEPIKT